MATKVEEVEIFTGTPDFEFEVIRQVEAKCEASHAFSSAPSMDEVNTRLKALAAKVGGNAVIKVNYDSGISLTSWRALKATGVAVRKVSDERLCPVCAEIIKKAATKCRFCGEVLSTSEAISPPAVQSTFEPSQPPTIGRPSYAERVNPNMNGLLANAPLRDSDAMPAWVYVLLAIMAVGVFIAFTSGM
ncbi:hypothetical protein [Brevundimonas sp.]|uniref:hypothetical protein n=2 Tax=Brevundimonas TaxID=41275 RepID=UPI00289C78C2|nr:hypothetical protein [Brevundimonas sp.]